MDFRNCPNCKASVLDDEAQVCPFCGASMKTGEIIAAPQSPAAKKPTAKSKPAAAPAAKAATPQAPSKPGRKAHHRGVDSTTSVEEDPFDVGAGLEAKAIPVSRKPEKGRMWRIECPMCESPGFLPKKAAGKDVKCWNPDCLMPVFTAPEAETGPTEPVETKKSVSGLVLGLLTLLVLAGGGWAIYAFVLTEEVDPYASNVPADPQPRVEEPEDEGPINIIAPTEEKETQELTQAAVLASALEQIQKISAERGDARHQAMGPKHLAEAYSQLGRLDQAQAQLEQLAKVVTFAPGLQVAPLSKYAWAQLQAGNTDAANASLNQATQLVDRLNNTDRDSLEAAALLGEILVAAGQTEQAARVISRRHAANLLGEFAAAMRNAEDFKTYDVLSGLTQFWVDDSQNPQWVAVTRGLIARNRADAAVQWARQADPLVANDSLAAWAGTIAQTQPADEVQATVEQQVDDPALRARLLAAAAATYAVQKDAAATSLLQTAQEALAGVDVPESVEVPSMVQIYRTAGRPHNGLPDPTVLRNAAAASLQIALAQHTLGQDDAAWQSLQKGQQYLVGIAPDLSKTQPLVQEYSSNIGRIRNRLSQELNLSSTDQAIRAYNQYRQQVDAWNAAAEQRVREEVRLWKYALRWGMFDKVFAIYTGSEASQDYATTDLPELLLAHAVAGNRRDASNELQKQRVRRGDAFMQELTRIKLEEPLPRDPIAFARSLTGRSMGRQLSHVRAFQWTTRFAQESQWSSGLSFVANLDNTGVREDCYRLLAAYAASRGKGVTFWNQVRNRRLSSSEQMAAYHGVIEGLIAKGVEAPATSVAAR